MIGIFAGWFQSRAAMQEAEARSAEAQAKWREDRALMALQNERDEKFIQKLHAEDAWPLDIRVMVIPRIEELIKLRAEKYCLTRTNKSE